MIKTSEYELGSERILKGMSHTEATKNNELYL